MRPSKPNLTMQKSNEGSGIISVIRDCFNRRWQTKWDFFSSILQYHSWLVPKSSFKNSSWVESKTFQAWQEIYNKMICFQNWQMQNDTKYQNFQTKTNKCQPKYEIIHLFLDSCDKLSHFKICIDLGALSFRWNGSKMHDELSNYENGFSCETQTLWPAHLPWPGKAAVISQQTGR